MIPARGGCCVPLGCSVCRRLMVRVLIFQQLDAGRFLLPDLPGFPRLVAGREQLGHVNRIELLIGGCGMNRFRYVAEIEADPGILGHRPGPKDVTQALCLGQCPD